MSVPFFLATMKAESRARNTSVWRAREAPTEMGSAGVMPKKNNNPTTSPICQSDSHSYNEPQEHECNNMIVTDIQRRGINVEKSKNKKKPKPTGRVECRCYHRCDAIATPSLPMYRVQKTALWRT